MQYSLGGDELPNSFPFLTFLPGLPFPVFFQHPAISARLHRVEPFRTAIRVFRERKKKFAASPDRSPHAIRPGKGSPAPRFVFQRPQLSMLAFLSHPGLELLNQSSLSIHSLIIADRRLFSRTLRNPASAVVLQSNNNSTSERKSISITPDLFSTVAKIRTSVARLY